MKIKYSLLLLACSLILTISCKKEKLLPFSPKNQLSEFQTEKAQIIDLDTLAYKEITGKHGTTIYFDRYSFEIKEGEKVQLELVELYDFKEVLFRNIQTVTTDDKLLESSGVLKVVFTANGKELKRKKGEVLKVYPPKGKLKDNDIFLSQTDSLDNITWDITNLVLLDTVVNIGGGISMLKTIVLDSISYANRQKFIKRTKSDVLIESNNESAEDSFVLPFFLEQNTSQWINIDRFVDVQTKINFELEDKQEEFSGFNIYINYENINSFMYEVRFVDNLNFYDIPLSEKTFITVIGENKEGLFYDKIELKETINDAKLQLNMKKTTKEELKKLFD